MLCTVNDYIFKGFNQPLLGSFIIPVGDLIDDLATERQEETQAIANVLEELEKIIQGRGIPTYSINLDRVDSMETSTFILRNDTMKSMKNNSIKIINDEAEKPLLTYDDLEEEEEKVNDVTSLLTGTRVNMKSLSLAVPAPINAGNPFGSSMRKASVNPLKNLMSPQLEKFASGMKNKLIEDKKQEDDRMQRVLSDRRSRDAQDLKNAIGGDSVKNIIDPKYEMDQRLKVFKES